ncbi:MAG: hypothetical protein A3C90_04150, partial [Candidatus Magasanikbacteria bacterium RIFCSPHIGHO2_02_FULL_51_14]
SEDVVVGDILILEAGDKVQADSRLIEAREFMVDESLLTGEVEPVVKHAAAIAKDAVIADRVNMAHRGTTVTNGTARAVVTAIGRDTEVGEIASLVKETREGETPLQTQLRKLSRILAGIFVAIVVIVFVMGLVIRSGQYSTIELFETSIALAVAAIPEGLLIALTVILAIGMQAIVKRNALVRRLLAAETLGSVSVICVDKTGTLTEGRMRVTRLVTAESNFDYDELRLVKLEKEDKYPDALFALRIAALCNNAAVREVPVDGLAPQFFGDTTETALAETAWHAGLRKNELDDVFRRVHELPFDSRKKYMATLNHVDHEARLHVKGAPEVLLKRSAFFEKNGKRHELSEHQREWFFKAQESLAGEGLRVLALAYGAAEPGQNELSDKNVHDLVFVGLLALSDPLREDVPETLGLARNAGIHVAMITGDHASTARAIGRSIGLSAKKENVITGEELAGMSDDQLPAVVKRATIFARVNPKDKIRIVQAFQKNGEVVAMTGDGVNDGPALKGADIGVAFGSGTDVAKEISDLVLLDDRFSTIVSAVAGGRTIYQNIKKVVVYLLNSSFTEIVLITGSIIGGIPLALLPAQILWINLVEEAFPTMALAFDKGDRENMKKPPRRKGAPIVDKQMKIIITIMSAVTAMTLFALYFWFYRATGDIALTRTITFVALGINSLFFIYPIRSMPRMIWQMNLFDNRYVVYSTLFGVGILAAAVYLSPLQLLLRTVPLNLAHWFVIFLFGMMNIGLIEAMKGIFLSRMRMPKRLTAL